jgi:hypothetical protein
MLADDRPINVRPWLYRIARNRSLNHLRRQQAIGVDSMDVHLSEGGLTTADKVHKREEFRALIGDVQELPETQKTALLLREIDALSYEQIAETMETTVPSVKSLLVRARVGPGRDGRGAQAHVRGGPRGARRGRRGAQAHDAAGAPPPAHVRPLHHLPQVPARHEQGARVGHAGRAAAALQEAPARQPRHDRRRGRRRGRGCCWGAAAGGAVSAGLGTVASKAVAGIAAAAIVSVGAVEVKRAQVRSSTRRPPRRSRRRSRRRRPLRPPSRPRSPSPSPASSSRRSPSTTRPSP